MHELSLAQDILRGCERQLGDPPGCIERVRLAVGELAAVEPELLVYAWEALTAGGPHAGAVLDIEWRPARQRCDACGEFRERTSGTWLPVCLQCGEPLRIVGGQDLDVLELTFVPLAQEGALVP